MRRTLGHATGSSQILNAGGDDRFDGSLNQGRTSGNMSATARKPLRSAIAITKKITMTSSPRVIGSPFSCEVHAPLSGTFRKPCLRTSEHRNKIPVQIMNAPAGDHPERLCRPRIVLVRPPASSPRAPGFDDTGAFPRQSDLFQVGDPHGRKLRRALVRDGCQRPDERNRPRPDGGGNRRAFSAGTRTRSGRK
jgi:hypothetical protein